MPVAGEPAAPARPDAKPDPEVPERARERRYSASYKLRFLTEYEGLNKAGKGALLRREGLYSSLISEWRKQRDHGALTALALKPGRPPVDRRDREIARLMKAKERLELQLEKAHKVNEIQGKLSALLEGLAAESAPGDSERT
jgi:transposase-like protein